LSNRVCGSVSGKAAKGLLFIAAFTAEAQAKSQKRACGYKRIISHLKTGGRCNH